MATLIARPEKELKTQLATHNTVDRLQSDVEIRSYPLLFTLFESLLQAPAPACFLNKPEQREIYG